MAEFDEFSSISEFPAAAETNLVAFRLFVRNF
jgi:hypothetical protein